MCVVWCDDTSSYKNGYAVRLVRESGGAEIRDGQSLRATVLCVEALSCTSRYAGYVVLVRAIYAYADI